MINSDIPVVKEYNDGYSKMCSIISFGPKGRPSEAWQAWDRDVEQQEDLDFCWWYSATQQQDKSHKLARTAAT